MARILALLASVVALAVQLPAQRAARPEILTNSSVVLLAEAGFDEAFLMDVIVRSRCAFDTTAEGLAGLAKQGLSQRIIRTMMDSANPGARMSEMPANAVLPGVAPPDPEGRVRIVQLRPKAVHMAVATQTPYYESTSFMWGLFRKRHGVGTAPKAVDIMTKHLGPVYTSNSGTTYVSSW